MKSVFAYLLLLAMLSWGLSWPLSKILTAAHTAPAVAFARFLLVSLFLLPLIFCLKISLKIPRKSLPALALNILFNALYSLVFFYALRLGDAGSAGVITTTLSPILATFLSLLLFKNRLNLRESFGLFVGLVSGAFLLDIFGANLGKFHLFFVLCALFWACVSLSARRLSSEIHPLSINFYGSFFSLFFYLPFLNLGDLAVFAAPKSMLLLCVIALFSSVFGTSIYFKGIEVLGIVKAASYTLLVPFFALLLSWVLLGEIPTFQTILGGSLAIFAIYLISFYDDKHLKFLARILGHFLRKNHR